MSTEFSPRHCEACACPNTFDCASAICACADCGCLTESLRHMKEGLLKFADAAGECAKQMGKMATGLGLIVHVQLLSNMAAHQLR